MQSFEHWELLRGDRLAEEETEHQGESIQLQEMVLGMYDQYK